MKRTKSILVALALAVLCIIPVAAIGPFYENKYVDTNPAIALAEAPERYQGMLLGRLRCSDNVFTKTVKITNDADPSATPYILPVRPDGTFEATLVPGDFTLKIDVGNGGQAEHSHFRIGRGFVSYPERELLGHATSETYPAAEDLSFKILNARYYATIGGAGSADVTAILQGKVAGGSLTVTGVGGDAYDTLFSVPAGGAFGTGRFLEVVYKYSRVQVSIIYAQDTAFTIP